MQQGQLFLIPTSLGSETFTHILPSYNNEVINSLQHFIVEDIRTARRFIRDIGYTNPIDTITFYELSKHTSLEEIPSFLQKITEGKSIGLISEAGCPCIADPGAQIVKIAHEKNITIIPLIGPSSILLSLIASGFNGQNFAFNGYLPIDQNEKIKKIKQLEQKVYTDNQTQLFIETPFRNNKLITDLLSICKPSTLLCIATNLTLQSQLIQTKSIAEWKKLKVDKHKKPTVFLIYK